MVPSSFMISQITEEGEQPAMAASFTGFEYYHLLI